MEDYVSVYTFLTVNCPSTVAPTKWAKVSMASFVILSSTSKCVTAIAFNWIKRASAPTERNDFSGAEGKKSPFNVNRKVVVVESFEVGAHFGEISLGTVEMSKIGTTPFLQGCFCQILNQIVRRGILSDCLVAFKRDSFMDDSLRRFAHNTEDKDCLVRNDSFIHNDCNLRSERKESIQFAFPLLLLTSFSRMKSLWKCA